MLESHDTSGLNARGLFGGRGGGGSLKPPTDRRINIVKIGCL